MNQRVATHSTPATEHPPPWLRVVVAVAALEASYGVPALPETIARLLGEVGHHCCVASRVARLVRWGWLRWVSIGEWRGYILTAVAHTELARMRGEAAA